MRAFTEAVDAGAHALETDIHLSKDGVVVLSHVSTRPTHSGLARCSDYSAGCNAEALLREI